METLSIALSSICRRRSGSKATGSSPCRAALSGRFVPAPDVYDAVAQALTLHDKMRAFAVEIGVQTEEMKGSAEEIGLAL